MLCRWGRCKTRTVDLKEVCEKINYKHLSSMSNLSSLICLRVCRESWEATGTWSNMSWSTQDPLLPRLLFMLCESDVLHLSDVSSHTQTHTGGRLGDTVTDKWKSGRLSTISHRVKNPVSKLHQAHSSQCRDCVCWRVRHDLHE